MFTEIDGVTYYSPNALRETSLILDDAAEDFTANPFKTNEGSRFVLLFQQGRGSTSAQVQFFNFGVAAQQAITAAISSEGNIYYHAENIRAWESLEHDLYVAITALSGHFDTPCILPFLPRALGYAKHFSSVGNLKTRLNFAREWFNVWLGALSYVVLCSLFPSDDSRPRRDAIELRKVLEANGLPPTWTDELQQSLILSFNLHNERAGTILDVMNPIPGQPSVEYLVAAGVPVWYRWSPDEEARAKYDAIFARLRPVTSGAAIPRPTQPSPVRNEGSNEANDGPLDNHVPEWIPFFEERERLKGEMLARETPEVRQMREARERCPPTSSCIVFEWWPSERGPLRYDRVPVPARWRFETLARCSWREKRYDSVFNEWDCCGHFAQGLGDDQVRSGGGSDSDEVDDYDAVSPEEQGVPAEELEEGELLEPIIDKGRQRHTFSMTMAGHSLVRLELVNEVFHSHTTRSIAQEAEEELTLQYGFCPSGGVFTTDSATVDHSREIYLYLRLTTPEAATKHESTQIYTTTAHCRSGTRFVASLAKGEPPAGPTWDLLDASLRPIRLRKLFSAIQRQPLPCHDTDGFHRDIFSKSGAYLVIRGSTSFKIVTLSARAALFACRLPETFSMRDVAFTLAQKGIPFRLLHPMETLERPIGKVRYTFKDALPVRRLSYTFTKDDYDSYMRMRTRLLAQPHMQAAIKRGGIVWRLSVATIGLSGIFDRPTRHNGYLSIELDDVDRYEDILLDDELDLICGMYKCVSDDGNQTALKSWWPLVRLWERDDSGENYGWWSSQNEAWFQHRPASIESDPLSNQPLNYTQWKSKLRGIKRIKDLHSYLEKASRTVLETRRSLDDQ